VRRHRLPRRTGIFELLVITDAIREHIRENPSINAIKAEARKNGMIYLQEDGLRQVIQGKDVDRELLRSSSKSALSKENDANGNRGYRSSPS